MVSSLQVCFESPGILKGVEAMKKIVVSFLTLLLLVSATGCQAGGSASDNGSSGAEDTSQPEPPAEGSFSRDVEVTLVEAYPQLSFRQPLEYLHAGDGSDRIFVVEKPGQILVFPNNPQAETPQVFLDLRGIVDAGASEKGLLGLAFHPDYQNNRYFFVNYTNENGTVIARYRTNPDNPERALADSGEVLLSFPQPYSNHNGGRLTFGKDGFLYIATGDGGSGGDPQNNAQNRSNLLGKILRIDVDNPAPGARYGIPQDNPFAGNTQGFSEEIYAYGLRNPWRFSFDEERDWLWAADVGQDKVEEINLIEKGKNYGWNIMEGSQPYKGQGEVNQDELAFPVWEYEHPLGKSITGGYVYYGNAIPALKGAYIYGDFISGKIWALWLDKDEGGGEGDGGGGGNGDANALKPDNRLLLESGLLISSFGVDRNNEIYVVDYQGKIYKLEGIK